MSPQATATMDWVRNYVVALNLCPFAAKPLSDGTISAVVCPSSDPEAIFYWAGSQVQHLLEAQRELVETQLLIIPTGLSEFKDFLGMVGAIEDFLENSGADAYVQLAHFHPEYRFADAAHDDPAHATNRSPYPTIQLLRTESVAAAIDRYGNTGRIPERNAALLRKLALDERA